MSSKKSSCSLVDAVTDQNDTFVQQRIHETILKLVDVDSFMHFLAHIGFEGTNLDHYQVVFDKLNDWIENPTPPDSHKLVIQRLGCWEDGRAFIFWTPFLECFFLDNFHGQFFRKRSKDLDPKEVKLIESICVLIKNLCRYGHSGENFHNVVQAGTYGACQFLSRVLRYYRDRENLVVAALVAVNYLTHSKANP